MAEVVKGSENATLSAASAGVNPAATGHGSWPGMATNGSMRDAS